MVGVDLSLTEKRGREIQVDLMLWLIGVIYNSEEIKQTAAHNCEICPSFTTLVTSDILNQ